MCARVRDYYPRWLLVPTLIGVLIGKTIEAGADLGGMAAAMNVLVPVPIPWMGVGTTATLLALHLFGSSELIRDIFRRLALALLAYVGAALLAKPDRNEVLWGTLVSRAHSLGPKDNAEAFQSPAMDSPVSLAGRYKRSLSSAAHNIADSDRGFAALRAGREP